MLVEDEETVRQFVRTILEKEGYGVTEAADAAGLRAALDGPAPAATILDLNLPDGNGLQLLPDLKRHWPTAKVIIMTGYGTAEVAEKSFMEFSVKSKWCKPDINPHMFNTGFEILDLQPDDAKIILRIVDEFGFRDNKPSA